MIHNNKLINIAEDNRIKCTCCENRINKGEKYFRDAKHGYRNSHTVNICYKCIGRMFLKAGITDEELEKIKSEVMIDVIEGEQNEN